MAFITNIEQLDRWRDHVARVYTQEPDTAAMLQLLASEMDRSTWEIRVTQADLIRRYGLSKASASRRWRKAMDTGLVYDTRMIYSHDADGNPAEGRILRLLTPPR
jgi:DNA-binding Lrp family transcriptional regulator